MKKCVLSLLLLVLACSFCWAFPLKQDASSIVGSQANTVVEEKTASSKNMSEIINPVTNILNDYATKSRITKADVQEAIDRLEAVNEDVQDIINEAQRVKWSIGFGIEVGYTDSIRFSPVLLGQANFGSWFLQVDATYDLFSVKEFKTAVEMAKALDPTVKDYCLATIAPTWQKAHASLIVGVTF